jgi:hypothetical protein
MCIALPFCETPFGTFASKSLERIKSMNIRTTIRFKKDTTRKTNINSHLPLKLFNVDSFTAK